MFIDSQERIYFSILIFTATFLAFVFLYFANDFEISDARYEQVLSWSRFSSVNDLVVTSMSDGEISNSEFSDIKSEFKQMSSSKLALKTELQGGK